MSRVLKFRAWDKERKQMFFPSSINFKSDGRMWVCDVKGENRLEYEDVINLAELMQFTGLHDKNGKEIWEGDIVLDHGYKGIVKFGTLKRLNFHGVFYLDLSEGGGTGGDAMFDRNLDLEVLGNIYENPELLQ